MERFHLGAVDNTGDWLARRAEQVGGAAVAGGQATASDFSNAMDQLRTMTPEQRDQFIEATQRGDDYISEEYGFGGEMAVAAAKLGRNVIGAAASGYNAAKEWLTGESDLSEAAKGMSLEQRGHSTQQQQRRQRKLAVVRQLISWNNMEMNSSKLWLSSEHRDTV